MAAVSDTSAKAAQALTILQALAPKLDDLYNGQVSLRQQVADLLVGAGVPDSLAAQVDALLVQAQLNESKVNAAIALALQPLPQPSTTPPSVPTITLSVNTLAGTAPGSVQLVPTINDPSSLVTKVECYRDSALIYTKLAAPFGYTDSGLAQGTYIYTEKIYYSGGAAPITSNAVQVTINAATQTGPITVDPIT